MKKTTANHPWMEKRLSEDEIEELRKQVSAAQGGSRVHSFCFEENPEHGQVIGFLREPTLQVKLRALDNIGTDKIFATGSSLLESLLIQEHSDHRIMMKDNPEFHEYYLGATTEAISLCKAARNTLKKKPTSSTTPS